MEQRNEMLRNMRLSERQKKGDVQHLLSRSFSQRGFSNLQSPPADISISVPQFPIPPTINEEQAKADVEETVSVGEHVCNNNYVNTSSKIEIECTCTAAILPNSLQYVWIVYSL